MSPDPDSWVPGPGAYERPDEGTFEQVTAVKAPLQNVTKEESELHNTRRRVQAFKKLLAADVDKLPSSRRIERLQEQTKYRKLQKRTKELNRAVKKQRDDRKAIQSGHRSMQRANTAAFGSRERRFFHPLHRKAGESPGPGTHTMSASIEQFGLAALGRAPSPGRSTRPPLELMTSHARGFGTYKRDLNAAGPGEYTPDLLISSPDGMPRTTADVGGTAAGRIAAGFASPITFGGSVRASSPSASRILGLDRSPHKELAAPMPMRPHTSHGFGFAGSMSLSQPSLRSVRTPVRRTPVDVGRSPSPDSDLDDTSPPSMLPRRAKGQRPKLAVTTSTTLTTGTSRYSPNSSMLSRTVAMEPGDFEGAPPRLDTVSTGLPLPPPEVKHPGPKKLPGRTMLLQQAERRAQARADTAKASEQERIATLEDWEKRTRDTLVASARAKEGSDNGEDDGGSGAGGGGGGKPAAAV